MDFVLRRSATYISARTWEKRHWSERCSWHSLSGRTCWHLKRYLQRLEEEDPSLCDLCGFFFATFAVNSLTVRALPKIFTAKDAKKSRKDRKEDPLRLNPVPRRYVCHLVFRLASLTLLSSSLYTQIYSLCRSTHPKMGRSERSKPERQM